MTANYNEVIRNHRVTVADRDGAIEGLLVLRVTDEGFLIDNVAVHPSSAGGALERRSSNWPRPRLGRRASTPSICTPTRR